LLILVTTLIELYQQYSPFRVVTKIDSILYFILQIHIFCPVLLTKYMKRIVSLSTLFQNIRINATGKWWSTQYSRLVEISRLIHWDERLIRESCFPRPSWVQFGIKFDILSESNLGVFSLKSDTTLVLIWPIVHQAHARTHKPPPPATSYPLVHAYARIHVTLSFGSSSFRDWSLQHNSSRRHEHKYYDRRLFMCRVYVCVRRWKKVEEQRVRERLTLEFHSTHLV